MKLVKKSWLPAVCILALYCGLLSAGTLTERADFKQFVQEMVERHNFDSRSLTKLFDQVTLRQEVIDAISQPAESKPWYQYRPIFVNNQRIKGGVEFWNENAEFLDRAETVYGVPPEIVTAIIGVETRYGSRIGRHRVMDSLATLAFDYPPRSKFFRQELEQFLLLAREEDADPLSIKGSYAGAMGQSQFIASSYRHYAVDFNGDGKRDLWNSTADAIGSVANYFKEHGWRTGQLIASPAHLTGEAYKEVVAQGIKPQLSIKELQNRGIVAEDEIPENEPAAVIELENKKNAEYWIGLNNFYVITRYNHSELYAMAVYQLSREIRAQRSLAMKSRL